MNRVARGRPSVAVLLIFLLTGCGGYRSSSGVSRADRSYLTEIGLLDPGEKVLFFSSSMTVKTSGNFFTDRRVASYWLYGDDQEKRRKSSATYAEVADISIRYSDDPYWSEAHDVTVTLTNATAFHVYLSGNRRFAERFFRSLQAQWRQSTNIASDIEYSVQSATSLTAGTWSALDGATSIPAVGKTAEPTNAIDTAPSRFYRVNIAP
jgi:hypothetical protein